MADTSNLARMGVESWQNVFQMIADVLEAMAQKGDGSDAGALRTTWTICDVPANLSTRQQLQTASSNNEQRRPAVRRVIEPDQQQRGSSAEKAVNRPSGIYAAMWQAQLQGLDIEMAQPVGSGSEEAGGGEGGAEGGPNSAHDHGHGHGHGHGHHGHGHGHHGHG